MSTCAPYSSVLIGRAGGTIEISNARFYDAVLPGSGQAERFRVEELGGALRLTAMPWPDQH
ncbi:hypothetical protein GCM10010170_080780 [Dactylosporangium salmoneum]|uniref:Uncharacterized protein n=1 Tax=Dactylosporangium salmoneum TaxID=53361 RepID=A0ABN3HDB0_9ACTN